MNAEECLVPNVPKKKPNIFIDEIMTQKEMIRILYYILDISNKDIGKMKIPQRIWLYGNKFGNVDAELSVTQRLFFKPPIRFAIKSAHGESDIPIDVTNNFESAIEYAKKIKDSKIYEEYEINNLRELLYLEILDMAKSGTMIRKCRHCDKYFVVPNHKTFYCDRMTESGKPCSVIGPKKSYRRKMGKEPALEIYNRAYNTHFKRCQNEKMSADDFSKWTAEAKDNLEKVRNGELDITSFQKWLKK